MYDWHQKLCYACQTWYPSTDQNISREHKDNRSEGITKPKEGCYKSKTQTLHHLKRRWEENKDKLMHPRPACRRGLGAVQHTACTQPHEHGAAVWQQEVALSTESALGCRCPAYPAGYLWHSGETTAHLQDTLQRAACGLWYSHDPGRLFSTCPDKAWVCLPKWLPNSRLSCESQDHMAACVHARKRRAVNCANHLMVNIPC